MYWKYIKSNTLEVLNFAIFAIFDCFREILYPLAENRPCFCRHFGTYCLYFSYDRFQTELVQCAWFPECNCLMSSFLFTSCYNVMSSVTSVLYLDNRTTRSETSTKTQCTFCWRWNFIPAKSFKTTKSRN